MLDIQLGRRNLSPIQRIAIAEKYRSLYEKQAKERQGTRTDLKNNFVPNLAQSKPDNRVNTKLADVAGVGKETYRMGARILNSNDEDLKQRVLSGETAISMGYKNLIETNIRQRVLGNTNPVKLGRCFEFLNKWYGFEKGNNQYSLSKVFTSSEDYEPHNQTELAQSYGITKQTMNNYIRMASMIPELEELIFIRILTIE